MKVVKVGRTERRAADGNHEKATAMARAALRDTALALAWRPSLFRRAAERKPVVLLYHGVVPAGHPDGIDGETFRAQVVHLQECFHLVGPELVDNSRRAADRIQVILTFDDGFRNNATVAAPILRALGVPAVFFICTRHSIGENYLWFSYMKALERSFPGSEVIFRNERFDLGQGRRAAEIRRLREVLLALKPHPAALYQAIENELPPIRSFLAAEEIDAGHAGMSSDEIRTLASDPLFSVGAHTLDHPLLSRCSRDEAKRQITGNKEWIEAITGRSCQFIAYPSGDYSAETLAVCREVGFDTGFAVIPHDGVRAPLEIPRLGVYGRSNEVLGFKVQWGSFLRRINVKVG